MRYFAVSVHVFILAARAAAFLLPVAASAIMAGAPAPPAPPPPATPAATKPDAMEERPPAAPPLPLPTAGGVATTAGVAAAAAAAADPTADTESRGSSSPSHLVVLSHGLAGTPEDLTYLKKSLERAGGPGILVHSARRNQGKTKDGVAEGGSRLAEEILEVVDSTPSLSRISLVGNSLGGLYVRYAVKLLYHDGDDDGDAGGEGGGVTVAGLKPSVFMTIACPHLGVRRFTYVPLPSTLHPLAKVVVGKTGADLFLARNPAAAAAAVASGSRPPVNSNSSSGRSSPSSSLPTESSLPISSPPPPPPRASTSTEVGNSEEDLLATGNGERDIGGGGGNGGGEEEDGGGGGGGGEARDWRGGEVPLLYDMATSQDFLRPLKAFRWRRAYANRRGDFMVPYGTAAFLEAHEGDGSEAPSAAAAAAAGGSVAAVDDGMGAARKASRGLSSVPTTGADADTGANTNSAAATGSNPAPGRGAVVAGTGSFTIADRLLGAKNGIIVGVSRVPPAAAAPAAPAAPAASGRQGELLPKAGLRVGVSARIRASSARRTARQKVKHGRTSMEEEMAAGLNSCGWEKVSVDFGGLAPFSHNKICALSRSPLTSALYGCGKSIVDHAADFLVTHDRRGVDGDNDNDADNGVDT